MNKDQHTTQPKEQERETDAQAEESRRAAADRIRLLAQEFRL
jgi:hypothetical protein